VQECEIDGEPVNFAEYLAGAAIDTRLPLVADYAGVQVNVSVQSIDYERGEVQFYAPVVGNEPYRFAHDLPLAGRKFPKGRHAADIAANSINCNCVLNFLHFGVGETASGGYFGPVTFGEIAYILLNQTLVSLQLRSTAAPAEAAAQLGMMV
jgi:hypothetical protein